MEKQKILIVEDNKSLAKLIAKKLSLALDMEVDTAFTLAEAKLFLKGYKYFVTVLDVNLPDAPDGEVIDYALKNKNHVLVLSANIDKDFRQKMLEKNIIDYVNKSGMNDIEYIINTIKRLRQNQQHKILVVDDSLVFRNQMKTMLENHFFNVITVAHGEEALGILNVNPDISLVLTDYNMPVMNGLELTKEIRKTYPKDQLSVVALSGNDSDDINALFLKNGANDYIKKPFSKEEFSCRITNSIEALENIQMITQYANRDHLTGLYNKRNFYNLMNEFLEDIQEDEIKLAIALIDIDNFKHLNDTYGSEVGDKVLVALGNILQSGTNASDIVARISEEDFCVVLKDIDRDTAADIYEAIRSEVELATIKIDKEKSIKFTISLGATLYNTDESIEENLNEADMLLYKAKHSGKNLLVFE
ncbi:GGDEF domain-containing response regulator [Sulfurimonas marina]|uniref:diguanylate cyclase n=1 Tax=Sulfurimonas marina TaxID=2590551 RepID=A0A7M1AT16_9BACT|nr:diguanylate cyclase [Sulfurimonas marina]QOP40559.1 diguanylate cyclase [Sulfurimonas marina]